MYRTLNKGFCISYAFEVMDRTCFNILHSTDIEDKMGLSWG